MIHKHKGNLLHVQKGIIVHDCNALGVMGSGVAQQVRQIFPGAYSVYRKEYERSGLKLGDVLPYRPRDCLVVANAITQENFGRDPDTVYVDYDGVRACFEKVKVLALAFDLPVHFPLIGCGLANGDWKVVSGIIDECISDEIGKHLWVPNDVSHACGDSRIAA